jgi:hypothetical protein
MTYLNERIAALQIHSKVLSRMLAAYEERLEPDEYSRVVQVIINTEAEIRHLQIARKHRSKDYEPQDGIFR